MKTSYNIIIISLVVLLVLLPPLGIILYGEMNNDNTKTSKLKEEDSIMEYSKITEVTDEDLVLEHILEKLAEGKFKEAQKDINLNISSGQDELSRRYLQELYKKVEILDKDSRDGVVYYTIKYPKMSTLLEKYPTIEGAIEGVIKGELDYITKTMVPVEVINGRIVKNSKLWSVLTLLEV